MSLDASIIQRAVSAYPPEAVTAEQRAAWRADLCARIRAGEDVPRADLIAVLDVFAGIEQERDALFEGWRKDAERRGQPDVGVPAALAWVGRRDGRSRKPAAKKPATRRRAP